MRLDMQRFTLTLMPAIALPSPWERQLVTQQPGNVVGLSGPAGGGTMTENRGRGKMSAAYTKAGFGERAYQQRLERMGLQQGGRWVTVATEPLSASQHIPSS
jgi:hypothetical protein